MIKWNKTKSAEIKDLIGKRFIKVENINNEELVFTLPDGDAYVFAHQYYCCESVTIEDIVGDLSDLDGEPILLAEESTSDKNPDGVTKEFQGSFTWTFYKFATRKGYVDVRWYGSSNGYYSEGVSLTKRTPCHEH